MDIFENFKISNRRKIKIRQVKYWINFNLSYFSESSMEPATL